MKDGIVAKEKLSNNSIFFSKIEQGWIDGDEPDLSAGFLLTRYLIWEKLSGNLVVSLDVGMI
ncbi:MAG: hypothetical protein SO016_06255 [Lachnospiraceae bacterium]|nr:hypothetical protein [Robinsoniella sp.]MDY3766288.1 hypothetical protein [Lachnospiraceae bacterium]